MQEFFQVLQYLIATNSINIIAGDLNYELLKVYQNGNLDIFTDQMFMSRWLINQRICLDL